MAKRLLFFGAIGSFILTACAGAVFFASIAGLVSLPPEKARPVKIALLAPLPTAAIQAAAPRIIEAPPGLVAAAVEQAAPANTPDPVPGPTTTPAPALFNSAPVLAPTATPSPTPLRPGQATRLVIPALNLDVPVLLAPVYGDTWQVNHLDQAVGHLQGTAAPGSDSNLVLAGHVTLAAGVSGPFVNLAKLPPGAMMLVYAGDEIFYYVADTAATVDTGAVEVTYPSSTGQITLITCINWSREQGRYLERFIVRGHLLKI